MILDGFDFVCNVIELIDDVRWICRMLWKAIRFVVVVALKVMGLFVILVYKIIRTLFSQSNQLGKESPRSQTPFGNVPCSRNSIARPAITSGVSERGETLT